MRRGNNLVIFSILLVLFAISYITKKNNPILEPLYSEPISYFSYINQDGSMFTANNLKDKISVVVGVAEDHLEKISAVDIINSLSKVLGGGGGGRPDFARAGGGNDKAKIPKACETIKELIKSL